MPQWRQWSSQHDEGAISPDLSAALNKLYDAVVAPDLWPEALEKLAATVGAAGSVLMPRDPSLIELGFPASAALTEVVASFVENDWYRTDLRAERAFPLWGRGRRVLVEDDITTAQERAQSPLYQEFLGVFGLPWWAGLGFEVDGLPWCFALMRGTGQGPYEHADVAHLAELSNHFQRVVSLAVVLKSQAGQRVLDLAELLDAAVVMLDRQGRIAGMSAPAEGLLGPDLTVRQRRLVAARPAEDRELQAAIQAAISAVRVSCQPNRFAVLRREAAPPLLVEAHALPGAARDIFSNVVAIVLLKDMAGNVGGHRIRPSAELAMLFQLSSAEARLAHHILRTENLRAAAAQSKMSYETARSHLKAIFKKTGTANQRSLVRLLSP